MMKTILILSGLLEVLCFYRPAIPRTASRIGVSMLTNEVDSAEIVVIGSGIGGLCCAAVLAAGGKDVCVVESHYEIGGCAHEFCYSEDGRVIPSDQLTDENRDKVYRFEAGPSLYSGLSQKFSPNPLHHVYSMIGEEPEWLTYDLWGAHLPEAPQGYALSIGAESFEEILRTYGGPTAESDWARLVEALRPLTEGVMQLPTVAIRPGDTLGSLRSVVLRYPKVFLRSFFPSLFLSFFLSFFLSAPLSDGLSREALCQP